MAGIPFPPQEWAVDPALAAQADEALLAQPPTGIPFPPDEWQQDMAGDTEGLGMQPETGDPVLDAMGATPSGIVPPSPGTESIAPNAAQASDVAMDVQDAEYEVPPWKAKAGERPDDYGDAAVYDAGEQAASVERQGDIEGDMAEADARGKESQAAIQAMTISNAEAAEFKGREELAKAATEVDAAEKEAADTKINEHEWADEQSDGAKLAWIVGAAITGMLNVRSGKQGNAVIDQMNVMIDRNLARQKSNLANKRDTVSAKQTRYQRLRERLGDERTADLTFGAMKMEQAAKLAEAQIAQFKSPLKKEEAAQTTVALRQAAAEKKQMATERASKLALDVWSEKAKISLGWAELAERRLARKDEADALKAKFAADQRDRVLTDIDGIPLVNPDGSPVLAHNAEAANKANSRTAASWSFYRDLKDYAEYTERMGRMRGGAGPIAGSPEYAEAMSKHDYLMTSFKQAKELGALDKGAVEVFNNIVAPPSTYTKGRDPSTGARSAMRMVKQEEGDRLRIVHKYQGKNTFDEYEGKLQVEKGAVRAKGNRQGGERDMPWFYDDTKGGKGLNKEGIGRTASDEDVHEYRAQEAETKRIKNDEYRRKAWIAENRKQPVIWKKQENERARVNKWPIPFPEVPFDKPSKPTSTSYPLVGDKTNKVARK